MSDIELYLNQIAQELIADTDAIIWFEAQPLTERHKTFQILAAICTQAHPVQNEVSVAIEHSGLKPTYTACVLLMQESIPERAFHKIISLPADEQIKSFRLLSSLFTIADTRRRNTECKDGCTHAWHNL